MFENKLFEHKKPKTIKTEEEKNHETGKHKSTNEKRGT
jgi:hypothetical protein